MKLTEQEQTFHVLIIEDDLRIAEVNRLFVEKVKGFHVVGIAANELEAKEQLDILQPDLILLDIYFPDMNGLSILSYVKERHYDTDVIMMTAAKEVDTVVEAIRLGVFDFLTKPLIFERLQQTLHQYREFRSKLRSFKEENEHISQDEIDMLMKAGGLKGQKELPYVKGIDKITLEKVSALLKQTGELTTELVSQEIGTSRSTSRRYLEYLVLKGEARADLVYGVVGRPERVYRRV
ncbi:response regulator [Brevibacillus migulae]|uniref:response regulator n=1 Tax=Brevibacillus migulae TaxID=1644114 RepID=UPI00106E8A59|nr:response regulator [Brevibacillus migulae]